MKLQFTVQDIAKELNIGPRKFFETLRADKILNEHNIPYSRFVDMGLLTMKQSTWRDAELAEHSYARPMVTAKGREYLLSRYGTNPVSTLAQNITKALGRDDWDLVLTSTGAGSIMTDGQEIEFNDFSELFEKIKNPNTNPRPASVMLARQGY